MEIHKPNFEAQPSSRRPIDITQPTRRVIADHTPDSIVESKVETTLAQASAALSQRITDEKRAEQDSLDISEVERVLAQPGVKAAMAQEADPAREKRIEELRQEFQSGRLNSPERIQRAAQAMIGRE